MGKAKSLMGISSELDEIIRDFAFLGNHYSEFHPSNAGDVSQVLSSSIERKVLSKFRASFTRWFDLPRIETLSQVRNDGRHGYRSQGVKDQGFYRRLKSLAGRLLLITRTGSQIPAILQTIQTGESGKLLNIIQVDKTGYKIRIVYGNAQYGSIPSIETHVHLLANSLSVADGIETPAAVHCHPYNLVLLARHGKIQGTFEKFNAILYTQIEGILRNYPDLIGLVPYQESGSEALVLGSIKELKRHRLVLWMNHGLVARAENIRRAYTLIDYAEVCASASIDSLQFQAIGIPFEKMKQFLDEKKLTRAYKLLKLK